MKKNKRILVLLTIVIVMFIAPIPVLANIIFSFSGSSSVDQGRTMELILKANPGTDAISAVGGTFTSSNPTCLAVTDGTGNFNENTGQYAYIDTTEVGFTTETNLTTLTLTAGATGNCSSTITFTMDAENTFDLDYNEIPGNIPTKSISVTIPVVRYNVTFNTGGGSTVPTQQVVNGETATRPNPPTRAGFTFGNWQKNGINYDFSTPVTSAVNLVATWTAIPTHEVTFNSDGGSSVSSQNVYEGSKVSRPNNPTKSGYTFDEWQLNGATYDFNRTVTTALALRATWTLNHYTVTYNYNGATGGNTTPSKQIDYNDDYGDLPTPTKTGYTFGGWYKDSSLTSAISSITKMNTASNHTIYAKWISDSVTTYEVSFTDGTTELAKLTVESGKTVAKPSNPTKEGYTFKAWTLNGNNYDFSTAVTRNITLKATWDVVIVTPEIKDATLSKLDVSGYTLSPTFKPSTTAYKMTVNNNITSLKVTALPSDSTAKVTISGDKNWKVGVNTIIIKVEATDGTTSTYTVSVTRKSNDNDKVTTAKSSDNYLKSITITDGLLTPTFNKNLSNYAIEVPNEVTKLNLKALTESNKSKIKITGNENFKTGETNTVEIMVTAEDGSVRIYTINVVRSLIKSNNKLTSLDIEGVTINPTFNGDVFNYNVKVKSDITDLKVNAKTSNKNATVEISGNKDLKFGNNTIIIRVVDENGFAQYYLVNVEKEATQGIMLLGFNCPIWLFIIIFSIIPIVLAVIVIVLSKKNKSIKEIEKTTSEEEPKASIDFKPVFNFGSNNGNQSDDDYVESNGSLAGGSINDDNHKVKEIPYDPYDDVVTKDEIVDAIKERDPEKLRMLLEQEELNKRKEELKEKNTPRHGK